VGGAGVHRSFDLGFSADRQKVMQTAWAILYFVFLGLAIVSFGALLCDLLLWGGSRVFGLGFVFVFWEVMAKSCQKYL
jgi:hypothetical protein